MEPDYNVIITGAGIAGMITAASAAKHSNQNHKILVVDRNPRSQAGMKTATGWVCRDSGIGPAIYASTIAGKSCC
jgi:2-polyprenyl-6-methoxyphenol hydroxylase-like FAD-dependent oxidoreductase